MRWLLLCVLAGSAAAPPEPSQADPQTVFREARRKLMLTIKRLPRYMCTETIDRAVFKPKANRVFRSCGDLSAHRISRDWTLQRFSVDRLRLDVSVSKEGEMYSWAGENRFQDRTLAELVRGGATSTGAFSSFLTSIFGMSAATFTYLGSIPSGGRTLFEYAYRVPLEKSTYSIGDEFQKTAVAYSGTFLVDPATADLVRLTIRPDSLPESLNLCEDATTLEYGKVQINNSEFFLPKQTVLRVVHSDGSELENRTVFSSCHEFLGESSIRFGDQSGSGAPAGSDARSVALDVPAGLPFRIALSEAIDASSAAAGDSFKARLTTPIKSRNGEVLVAKGAGLFGRIAAFGRTYPASSEVLTVGLRLESVEIGGSRCEFHAFLESSLRRHHKSVDSIVPLEGLQSFGQKRDENSDVGFLNFIGAGGHYIIRRGLEIEGVTASPNRTRSSW